MEKNFSRNNLEQGLLTSRCSEYAALEAGNFYKRNVACDGAECPYA